MNRDFKLILLLFALIVAVVGYLAIRQRQHIHKPFPDMATDMMKTNTAVTTPIPRGQIVPVTAEDELW